MKQHYKIYYSAIISLCLLIIPLTSRATHLYGGEILARAINCQTNTYETSLVLYTDPNSDFEFGDGIFYLGHGQTFRISDSLFTMSDSLNQDSTIKIVSYSLQHTFPGPGTYRLYFRDFNRNAEVANMSNSVQTPFFTQTELTIDPLLGCNSTPELSSAFTPFAFAKNSYVMPLAGRTDADGDSLSYELVTPLQNVNEEVVGYRLPHQFDLRFAPKPTSSSGESAPDLFVNRQGELVWDAPNLGGEFALAVRVNEWRKVDGEWSKIGFVSRDIALFVQDTLNGTEATSFITSTHEEVSQAEVNMFPNPTPGVFTVEINEDQWLGGTLSIYNIIGQKLLEEPIALGSTQYDISSASQGVYFLTLQNGSLKKTIRFMKR